MLQDLEAYLSACSWNHLRAWVGLAAVVASIIRACTIILSELALGALPLSFTITVLHIVIGEFKCYSARIEPGGGPTVATPSTIINFPAILGAE
jgi:CBS domain containing-hemolysin-like protein